LFFIASIGIDVLDQEIFNRVIFALQLRVRAIHF
jgi:hypothetical protein